MERFSEKREAILKCLQETDSHPTAEWLYQRLRPKFPGLSLGTVYRNLCQLKEAGLVLSMGVQAGEEHYDGNVLPHPHVVCTNCGKVADLDAALPLQDIYARAEASSGFRVISARLMGLCPDCAKAAASDTDTSLSEKEMNYET